MSVLNLTSDRIHSTSEMRDTGAARRYRFGAFEADASTGELRRQGIRIKLNAQPFQVLVMFLERPGQLLTREEISRELWPDGTFVDSEHGVNSAINRIREALRDTANNPRFVETLARRSYRFVAPVERISGSENLPPQAFPLEPEPEPVSMPSSSISPLTSIDQTAVGAAPEARVRSSILASPADLPKTAYPVVQTLFVLLQIMYLGFYIGALANLAEIEELFSTLSKATQATIVLIVTAGILIPVRAFVLTAVLFHAPGVRATNPQHLAASCCREGRGRNALALPAPAPHQFRSGTRVHRASGLFALCSTLARPHGCRWCKRGNLTYGDSN